MSLTYSNQHLILHTSLQQRSQSEIPTNNHHRQRPLQPNPKRKSETPMRSMDTTRLVRQTFSLGWLDLLSEPMGSSLSYPHEQVQDTM